MEDQTLWLIIIAAFILNLVILYFIIYFATKSANDDLLRAVRILVNLKAAELKKEGIDVAEAKALVNKIDELNKLKGSGKIAAEELKVKLYDQLI
jgi:hypothetical protein